MITVDSSCSKSLQVESSEGCLSFEVYLKGTAELDSSSDSCRFEHTSNGSIVQAYWQIGFRYKSTSRENSPKRTDTMDEILY